MFAQPQRALFVATPLYRYLCLPLQAFASKQTTTTGGGAPKFRGFISSLGRFIYRDTSSTRCRFGFLFSLSANPLLIHGHIVAAEAIFSFLRQPLHPAAAANATNMGTVKKNIRLDFPLRAVVSPSSAMVPRLACLNTWPNSAPSPELLAPRILKSENSGPNKTYPLFSTPDSGGFLFANLDF